MHAEKKNELEKTRFCISYNASRNRAWDREKIESLLNMLNDCLSLCDKIWLLRQYREKRKITNATSY